MRGDRTRTEGGTESLGEKAPRPRGNAKVRAAKMEQGGCGLCASNLEC